jgi:hypothetical protein
VAVISLTTVVAWGEEASVVSSWVAFMFVETG